MTQPASKFWRHAGPLLLLYVASLFLFSSCKQEDSLNPEPDRQIICIKTETVITQDGIPIGSTEHRYNVHDQLEVEITYDVFMHATDSAHFSFDEKGLVTRKYYYNITNDVTQIQTYAYDENGREIMNQLAINGSIYNRFDLFRGEDGDVDSIHVNSQGITTRHIYQYESDKVKWIREYDNNGNLINEREYIYDGQKTTLTMYNDNGEIITKTELLYDSKGQEVELMIYNAGGELIITRSTIYDERGNTIKVTTNYIGHGVYVHETSWTCVE